MNGKLYLCATPIGNLGDITMRVLETLKSVDLIAAEDTRNSIRLLNHFGIKTPMTSYHEYNKYEKAALLVEKMKSGREIALITDAGTPGISDPGEELVKQAYAAGIAVTSLPGAAAFVDGLILSGLSARRMCFEGFLPSDKKERRAILSELKEETRTIVLYEAPHRVRETLEELYGVLGDRKTSICRELTKRFETVLQLTLSGAVDYFHAEEPRGEFVIIIEGRDRRLAEKEEQEKWAGTDLEAHMDLYLARGMEKKEAMKAVARDRGMKKREIYQALLEEKQGRP